MRIIVDGYNLIRQSGEFRRFEQRGLEQGRNHLVTMLSSFAGTRRHHITIVFDGWENGSFSEERTRAGGISIIFSRRGEKADDVIRRLANQGGRDITVVTSDRDLAYSVSRSGANVISSRQFEASLTQEHSGLSELKGDEKQAGPRPGTKKKGPSRRMPKNKRATLNRISKL